jgi:hypothetical protein
LSAHHAQHLKREKPNVELKEDRSEERHDLQLRQHLRLQNLLLRLRKECLQLPSTRLPMRLPQTRRTKVNNGSPRDAAWDENCEASVWPS